MYALKTMRLMKETEEDTTNRKISHVGGSQEYC